MKLLVVFCLVAVAVADEEKTQEKKTQTPDQTTTPGLTQPTGSLLNSQVFPPLSFGSPVSNLAYTGFNGNISPLQTVNPDFFTSAAATPGVVNGALSAFPVTRAVLPGTSGVQSAFPVTGGVFPGVINGITPQFPGIGSGILQSVTGGSLDTNTATTNGAIPNVPTPTYRFLTPEGFSGIGAQGLQTPQTVGLSAIPTFTGGVLPSFASGVLQGQNIPSGVLKNPTPVTTSGISNIPSFSTGNISSGSLGKAFRQA